ncbi:MAG: hypothetical protein KatS3mg115_0305 [Candidatus Poribacteria bacterium]|nr:MAG: hypothetical protein KatS3mg115_0305 [Candidatus Poribacteria bacterium]
MAARRIRIQAGKLSLLAELNETQTAQEVWKALPLQARGNRWGQEIYFPIPVQAELELPQAVVEPGDLAYWPPGRAFCIFFGPTPASQGGECRPASPVTVIGRLLDEPETLVSVPDGASIVLEREEEPLS